MPALAAVPVNSNYDTATRSAVRDYQRVNRLPVTGETSPARQTHLQLRNDAQFRHLGTTTQDNVLRRVVAAPTAEARGNLVRLATEPSFSQPNGTHQAEMLGTQAGSTGPRTTDGLIRLSQSPQFRSLNDATWSTAIQTLGIHDADQASMNRFTSMATNPQLARMAPAEQGQVLHVFNNMTPADPSNGLRRMRRADFESAVRNLVVTQ